MGSAPLQRGDESVGCQEPHVTQLRESTKAELYDDCFTNATSLHAGGLQSRFVWVCLVGHWRAAVWLRLGVSAADFLRGSSISPRRGCQVAALVGALAVAQLSDRFGRKRLLILSALLFTVSSLGTGLALLTPRSSCGASSAGGHRVGSICRRCISPGPPAQVRGKLVSINQLTIVIGILLAQVVNWLIAQPVAARRHRAGDSEFMERPVGLGAGCSRGRGAVAAVLSRHVLRAGKPRWLAKNGQRERARGVLARIGRAVGAQQAIANIEARWPTRSNGSGSATCSNRAAQVRFSASHWPCCSVGGDQLIFYYTKDVFAAAGYKVSTSSSNPDCRAGQSHLHFRGHPDCGALGRRFLMLAGWAGLA